MTHFLQDRSCNDDFYITTTTTTTTTNDTFTVTRSTCEPNRLQQDSYVDQENENNLKYPYPYANANIYFRENKNILSWEPDPRLEAIDARLEQICAEEETRWNDDNNDQDDDDSNLGFTLTQSFESNARLEAIDAKLETDYKTETIFMEITLSESEDDNRPSFDDKYRRVEDFDLYYYHFMTKAQLTHVTQ